MLKRIRKSYITKGLALCLVFNLLGEIIYPSVAYGLTSGPIDINQASFEPASTSEMVNLATGDFTYNIPLLDVDGYPINIAYHGGVSMEQEASIVGLGWTLNVGALNRMKRGLPDDFKGDEITTEMNIRPTRTTGGVLAKAEEVVGAELDLGGFLDDLDVTPRIGLSKSIGVSFNNYSGYSVDFGMSPSASLGVGNEFANMKMGLGMGLESSSSGGITIDPRFTASAGLRGGDGEPTFRSNIGIGFPVNTVSGLQNININAGTGIMPGSKYVHGAGTSASLPISTVTFTPSVQFERDVRLNTYDFDYGIEALPWYTNFRGNFFRTTTCLRNTIQETPAFGYMYEQEYDSNEDYLLDFNRDGSIIPNNNIAYLPVTNHTFDLYSATAQGVGFSSRAFRSDVLTLSKARRQDDIGGMSFSAELGIGPTSFQAGLNLHFTDGFKRTGNWSSENDMKSIFKPNSSGDQLYEEVYFKKLGNRTASSTDFYTDLGGDEPLRQEIDEDGVVHQGTANFVHEISEDEDFLTTSTTDFSGGDHYRSTRDLRNTNLEFITAKEASNYGFDEIRNHTLNDFTYTSGSFSSTVLSNYGTGVEDLKEHHIGEMTVLKGDGSRYIYGIPVINRKTEEVSFNVSNEYPGGLGLSDLTADCEEGLINYSSGVENSDDNRRGDNNLYLRKSIPASANSHLLSAYLSSNYIDRTGDGPTPDDFGGYTKFNYSQVSTTSQPTKWRIPFDANKAAYNEGLKSSPYDDMGSYVYGERDQWLLHSIESKNFVAIFKYGDRHDGYGVADENGGIASYNNSKRLVAIELYTRKQLQNGDDPIKTVHFEYDYLLCQEIPNNDGNALTIEESSNGVSANQGGKLTLKGIYFTYGSSKRGKLHQYTFEYNNLNPVYELGQTDRWGMYQDAAVGCSCDPSDPATNFEYPYTTRDKTEADDHAAAWTMSTVNLPSGSKIDIELEADDYSYVMEKEASKMFKIRGMSEGGGTTVEDLLYDNDGDKNYIHVALDQNLGSDYATAKTTFIEEYVGDIQEIYFKFLVSVSPKSVIGTADEEYEYVSGYAEIDRNDLYVSDEVGADGLYDTGLIRLKSVHIKDKEKEPDGDNGISPITKASWQFMRKYLSRNIYPVAGDIFTGNDAIPYDYGCGEEDVEPDDLDTGDPDGSDSVDDDGAEFTDIINLGKSHLNNILTLGGVNFMMKSRKFASNFIPEKSWVRLYQGDSNMKIGGGHRVKKISVNDNWNTAMPDENSSNYGTQYVYTKMEDDELISSGVASYEPITAGADENTYRKPVHYSIDVKFRVNDNQFQDKPIGESIFASANVAYSQVEIKNLDYTGVDNSKTGQTYYEFYTARDFPSVVESTARANTNATETKTPAWMALLTGDSHYYLTMTQGYSIQMNDMHGKFKSKLVTAAQPTDGAEPAEIYSMKHLYYTESDHPKKLDNNLNVVSSDGIVSSKFIGKDIDMVLDLNESRSYSSSFSIQFGIEGALPLGLPILPSMWVSTQTQDHKFRSSVTTKVVYSNGILKEIELKDKGRIKRTSNVLFDEKTGVPIVTRIDHELGDGAKPIYQYDYPAYWMYEGMGMASENWGARFTDIVNADGKITLAGYENFLNPGDEIAVSEIVNPEVLDFVGKYWVLEEETTGDYYLINELGDIADYYDAAESYDYKVIRSGKRNLLGSTAASITSLDYDEDAYTIGYAHSNILNASAVEYTENAFGYGASKYDGVNPPDPGDWNDDLCGLVEGQDANPYVQGLRANWNLLASYVFDGDRNQTLGEIRKDGTLDNYIDFWENTLSGWSINTDPAVADRWIKAAIATIFEREGYNLESKDALGIYSSILLGYNKTLKVAEAVNARYYEIGFDGFEDRDYDVSADCTRPHFRFSDVDGEIINNPELAHSGRHSLKLEPGFNATRTSSVVNDIDHTTTDHGAPYVVQAQELIGTHQFIIDETDNTKFVLTAWVKEEKSDAQVITFDGAQIDIPAVTIVEEKRSNIIDGWQRVEIVFTMAGETITGSEDQNIVLKNVSETNNVYFDDIRIQPFNSEMVSYVIDPISLRLWATLDSRNFGTFYQYDEEGSLIRIIQETERGKVTVQENRAGIRIE